MAQANQRVTKLTIMKLVSSAGFKARPKSKAKLPDAPVWRAPKNDVVGSATTYLNKHKPGPARIVTHHPSGKWECAYPGYSRKSVSWTSRGLLAAQCAVLKYFGDLHMEATMELPPFDFAGLEKRAAVDVD